jgi:hypothetical protein
LSAWAVLSLGAAAGFKTGFCRASARINERRFAGLFGGRFARDMSSTKMQMSGMASVTLMTDDEVSPMFPTSVSYVAFAEHRLTCIIMQYQSDA